MEYKHSHYLSNHHHLVPKSYNGLPLTPSAPAPGPLTTRVFRWLPGFSQLPLTRELIILNLMGEFVNPTHRLRHPVWLTSVIADVLSGGLDGLRGDERTRGTRAMVVWARCRVSLMQGVRERGEPFCQHTVALGRVIVYRAARTNDIKL